ncbi:MAG: hypothetical protein WC749_12930 [Dehalococcoidia bacterium]
MKVEKVGEELVEGVRALSNLLFQLESAIEEAHFPYRKDAHNAYDRFGYYFTKDKEYHDEFWCGVVCSEPQYLVFKYTKQLRMRVSPIIGEVDIEKYPRHPEIKDELKQYWRLLPFRERGFFSLQASEQVKEIRSFIQACVAPTVT